jgi:type IV pilus assembly PilX-like protein
MKRDFALLSGSARPDAGNAMIVALLILFLLTSLGISYVAVTKGDKQIAGNQMTAAQAFSNAEAGISEVMLRMSDPSDATNYIGEPSGTVTPGWGKYVVNDPGDSGLDPQYNSTLSDGLNNNGNASIDEASEHYPETGSKQSTMALTSKLDYPWVKVRYKLNGANQVLLFGDDDNNPTTPPKENLVRGVPELIVTAAGRKGVGAKTVTVEAIKWPLPPVPGSVYTEGNMNFVGNSFYIDGHDHNPTAPYDTVTAATPLAGISSPNNATPITNAITGQQIDNVQGSGADPSVQTSPINLDLPAIAASWSQLADINYVGNTSSPDMSNWGTIGDLKVVHVAGDLTTTGNGSGAGVLIVDGDFHLGGTINYNGIVIVLGNVDVQGGGFAQNIVGGLMVQGTLTGTTNVAGNVKLLYSSAMINQLYSLTRYEISSWIDQ